MEPKSLLESMHHGVILRLGSRKRNGLLFDSQPGNQTTVAQKNVPMFA